MPVQRLPSALGYRMPAEWEPRQAVPLCFDGRRLPASHVNF